MAMIMQLNICGVPVKAFANPPTPKELGAIVARMTFEAQADFLIEWAEQLENNHGGRGHNYQINRIAECAHALDEELGGDYAAGFVADLAAAVANVKAEGRP